MNTLLPFQKAGVAFALDRERTLIADEMGLGKTVQAVEYLNANTRIRTVLVICPASLKRNWQEQLDVWLRRSLAYVIVNYERLPAVQDIEWDCVIVDEAHYIKNETSARHEQVRRLTAKAKHVLALTGTPIENCPAEFWALLSWLDPTEWIPQGMNEKRAKNIFIHRYCDPKRIVTNPGLYRRSGGQFGSKLIAVGAANIPELVQRATRVMVRRLKTDVLPELPAKRREIVLLDSEYDDSDLPGYHDISEDTYELAVTKLKADRVAFNQWSSRRHEQGLDKVRFIGAHVQRLLTEDRIPKVIVFAHHRDVIDELFMDLTEYEPVMLTGDSTEVERAEAVDAFQNDERCRVFIGSIAAAGVGLTLTAASHVVFAELDPVPGRMNQAEDRAHRIGQRDMVMVQHLVFDRTLDARICKILLRKQEILSDFDTANTGIRSGSLDTSEG